MYVSGNGHKYEKTGLRNRESFYVGVKEYVYESMM